MSLPAACPGSGALIRPPGSPEKMRKVHSEWLTSTATPPAPKSGLVCRVSQRQGTRDVGCRILALRMA